MYTISLVANKLGKNMLAFAEELSYSQDDKNVLLGATSIFKVATLNGKRPLLSEHTYPPP